MFPLRTISTVSTLFDFFLCARDLNQIMGIAEFLLNACFWQADRKQVWVAAKRKMEIKVTPLSIHIVFILNTGNKWHFSISLYTASLYMQLLERISLYFKTCKRVEGGYSSYYVQLIFIEVPQALSIGKRCCRKYSIYEAVSGGSLTSIACMRFR